MSALANTFPVVDAQADLRSDWAELARRVSAWRPAVIVLVARKPERLIEALKIDFDSAAMVITDLAIPFCRRQLDGARVAVVDDLVVVGSTVRTVAERLDAAGADEVCVFSMGHVDRTNEIGHLATDYVFDQPLDADGLRAFAASVPDALQRLAKPYDLDFPLLPCRLRFPITRFDDLVDAIVERHGDERVWDLTTGIGGQHGVRRLSVDMSGADGAHRKVRLYFDAATGVVNVMPISIPDELPVEAPSNGWAPAEVLWTQLESRLAHDELDARSRLRLFIDALQLGAQFLDDHSELLAAEDDHLFSRRDAELVMGPVVSRAIRAVDWSAALAERPPLTTAEAGGPSPFLTAAREHGFPAQVRATAQGEDVLSVFLALFDQLAIVMGAGSPATYAWTWPHTADAVAADPYLRLRVGPTSADIAELLAEVSRGTCEGSSMRAVVSRLLDHFIDAGSVVPTIAIYGGKSYRIYRKGEKEGRIEFADLVDYAVSNYAGDLSRTRVAKVVTALSYSRPADPLLEVKALPRGNALCFRSELFDDPTDVTRWMRDTGRRVEHRQDS